MVEITPEIQAQLNEQKKQCIFCKIIAGEIESKKVYEDAQMLGILDINPAVKGHTIFLPKEHYPIMPYLPSETFKHLFGMMAKLIDAEKQAMMTTGANIFIANGGVAGQQAPHFLIHLFPREKGDHLDLFALDEKKAQGEKAQEVNKMLTNNLPIMMHNHFSRNPAPWHTGNIKTAPYLEEIKKRAIYEDEKALCVVPENPQCNGHLVIYAQEEEKLFENLSEDAAAHLFYVASFAATAVFEGLGAHGSNIILKTGESNDNPEGTLCIHVLPRFQDDGLDLLWTPMDPKPDVNEVSERIKDKTFMIQHEKKKKEKPKVINLDKEKQTIGSAPKKEKHKEMFSSPEEEIQNAIKKIKGK